MTIRPVARRGEGGFAAIEFALGVFLILFPLAALGVTLSAWPDRVAAARVVAAEAARAASRENTWSAATSAGSEMARQVAANYGLDAGKITVSFTGSVDRGGAVTARVGVVMPVLHMPGVASAGGWTWTTQHTEATDLYRSRHP